MKSEDRIKLLFSDYISTVRKEHDIKESGYVYDNQINTAKNIIYNMWSGGPRWSLLFAEMQSGKSGSFLSVPYIISKNELIRTQLGIDMFDDSLNVFLLTSMNDVDLNEQHIDDIKNIVGGKYIKNNVLKNSDMKKLIKYGPRSISEIEMVKRMSKNSLILIDESDYGSDKKMIINNFLKNVIGINPNGDINDLNLNNIYVVSISATPMSEFISSKNKKLFVLPNQDSYYGITKMFLNRKVHQSWNLNNNEVDNFIDDVIRLPKNGYILVRCTNKQRENLFKRIGQRLDKGEVALTNLSKEDYYQGNKKDINDDILRFPTNKKVLIFIKGKLRAGKRLDTTNIIMTHDTFKSKTDTTVQSFLGRCCGYNKNQDVEIYCDLESAKEYKKWVESGLNPQYVPTKARNIVARVGNDYIVKKVDISSNKIIDDKSDRFLGLTVDITENDVKKLNKPRFNMMDRVSIIKEFLPENEKNMYFKNDTIIGSLFRDTKSKTFIQNNGNMCIVNGDREIDYEDVNKNIITQTVDFINKKIYFSIGIVEKNTSEVSTDYKSMYHI
jgi:hypothetical protein